MPGWFPKLPVIRRNSATTFASRLGGTERLIWLEPSPCVMVTPGSSRTGWIRQARLEVWTTAARRSPRQINQQTGNFRFQISNLKFQYFDVTLKSLFADSCAP